MFKEEVKKRGKSFYWNLFEQHLQAFLVPCDFYACKAGLNNVYVATDGNIYTCIELPEFKIGNVNEGLDVMQIRKIAYREDVKYETCKNCKYIKHCKTRGCQASNYEIHRDIYHPVEVSCHVNKTMFDLFNENFTEQQKEAMRDILKRRRDYGKK